MSRGRRWIGSLGGAVPYVRWMVFRHQLCVIDRQGVKVRPAMSDWEKNTTRCTYVAGENPWKVAPLRIRCAEGRVVGPVLEVSRGKREPIPLKASGLYKNKKSPYPIKAPWNFVGRFGHLPEPKLQTQTDGLQSTRPFSVKETHHFPTPNRRELQGSNTKWPTCGFKLLCTKTHSC